MRFFENFFGELNIVETTGEATVRCPFPHKQADGTEHIENTPSAHINPDKGTFHCKVPNCQSKRYGAKGGLSETSFLAAVQGISYGEATRILQMMEENVDKTEEWEKWHRRLLEGLMDPQSNIGTFFDYLYLRDNDAIKEYRLGYKGKGIVFPIFIYGEYMGACDYHPKPREGQRKALLEKGTASAIWPFDSWLDDARDTYLCAGFKDAMSARIRGLNAITFTHGEGSFPKLYKRLFKGRKVYICYDNDEGGREGAKKTATLLKEVGALPVIVDLSPVCKNDKEDIWDFFNTYDKEVEDLVEMAHSSPIFTEEEYEEERERIHPVVSLQQSTSGKVVGQIISSRVSVVADYAETYRVPDVVEVSYSEGSQVLKEGEVRMWSLEEENIEDILKLGDSNLKEHDIRNNIMRMVDLPTKEACHMRTLSYTVVHKAVVTDDTESEILREVDGNYTPFELTVYSVGDENKLVNGNKYRIFYKSVAHPYKAQEIVGVLTKVEDSDTSVNAFKVNEDVIKSLKCFQVDKDKNVKDKMDELYQRSKAFLGPEANAPVFLATELFYHTPLAFMPDEKTVMRAYLEAMIVGESRTHKSATAKGLVHMYELGTFISLKNSTTAGLIGGSQGSSSSGYKTRLGVIPRNHKGAVILEEFSGAPPEFIKSMTDIRSSNVVRIQRAAGTLTAPAMVRMLTLSNAKPGFDGTTLPLTQYPSGLSVLLELVGTAEDIARYDYFVIKDEGEIVDPNTKVEMEAYDKESYKNRVRWIWSRKPEQVKLSPAIRDYIVDTAKELNRQYGTHIQIFGREAWKKVARIAIAVAACVCSMDETGENVIVNEEHVLWAKKFLIACYDNDVFRMKQYVLEERAYTDCDRNDVQMLQGIYDKNSTLLESMERGTEFTYQQLKAVSGEKDDGFNKLINRLTNGHFIRWGSKGSRILPSAKFRTAMKSIDRQTTSLRRV